jgi:Chromo (CHRromatin Organisation MOdifier) domain
MATAVHNNSRNSTTGFSSNELLIGWEPPLVAEQQSESKNQTAEEYLSNLRRNRLMAIHALNKTAYKTNVPLNRWTMGQLVWLEGKNLPLPYSTAKLAPSCHGPFKIVRIISPVAVQLELPAQWNIHPVFHTSLITAYTETPSHGPNFTRPPPDLIDGEAEYEVEQIRSHWSWGRRKSLQYLIKWRGYPESDNTWENADQVHALILIKLYHQALPSANLKAQRIQLEGDHSPTLSPPKTLSRPLSSPTILRESTAALVWSKAHKRDIRSACSPLNPLVLYLSACWTHAALPLPSVTFTGNPSILQTSTANNNNLPSGLPLHAPDSSTQCHPSHPTTPPPNHLTKTPSNSHLALAHLRPCPSHRVPFTLPSKPRPTSTTRCYVALPTDSSKPSPTERRAPAWLPNATKTTCTTWSRRYSITSKLSTSHLKATSSTMGRLLTSTSRSAEDCIKRPNGFGSMTMVQCRGTTAPKVPMSDPMSSTCMPPRIIASTPHSNHSQRGSATCSLAQAGTSRFSKKLWPILETGVMPERMPATTCWTMRSQLWRSRSRNTNVTRTQLAPALGHVSPVLCLHGPQRGLPPCKTYQRRLGPYARDGRRPPICCAASMSAPCHWRMSKDVRGRPS